MASSAGGSTPSAGGSAGIAPPRPAPPRVTLAEYVDYLNSLVPQYGHCDVAIYARKNGEHVLDSPCLYPATATLEPVAISGGEGIQVLVLNGDW